VLQERGGISREEMFRAFNMGVGMIIVCASLDAPRVLSMVAIAGEPDAFRLGFVVSGNRTVRYL
jgi:phosphoribosylformylglycinamidine cyclo-ligase